MMLLNEPNYQLLLALVECYRFIFDIRCFMASGISNLSREEKIKFIEEYAEIPKKIDALANHFSKNTLPASIENIDIDFVNAVIERLIKDYPESKRHLEQILLDLKYLIDFTTDFNGIIEEIRKFIELTGLQEHIPLKKATDHLSSILAFKKAWQKENII